MKLENKKIGIAFTGSFCTFEKAFTELRKLKKAGADLYPRRSQAVSAPRMNTVNRSDKSPGTILSIKLKKPNQSDPNPVWMPWSFSPALAILLPNWQTASQIQPFSWQPRHICAPISLWSSRFLPMTDLV